MTVLLRSLRRTAFSDVLSFQKRCSVGVASSIPLLRYFIGQLSIMLIALYLMFFAPISGRVSGVLDMTTFNVTKSAAYIGLAVTSFVPIFIMFLSLMPKFGKKVTSGILKLGGKLKIVKNYDAQYNKVIKHVDEFQNSMRYFSSNAAHIIILMILTAVEYIAFLSIPYFICLAFGETAPGSFTFPYSRSTFLQHLRLR